MFVLQFISGKYQGGEFPLKPGKQIIIGRAPELELALVEDMVSRKHAKLVVLADGRVSIEDLGSSNGTFVNGEKIAKPTRLREGDRVLIGTSILKLAKAAPAEESASEAETLKNIEVASQVAAQRRTRPVSSMTGRIEELALSDLLQLFGTSKKNGILVIRNQREGRIYLRKGCVYYAVIDGDHAMGPLKSFLRIARWEEGEFTLLPPDVQSFPNELDLKTEALLLDAARQSDELARVEKSLPFSTRVRPVQPLVRPLRELSAAQLDAFQAALNHPGEVRSILDQSAAPDLDLAQSIAELLRLEYLQRA